MYWILLSYFERLEQVTCLTVLNDPFFKEEVAASYLSLGKLIFSL